MAENTLEKKVDSIEEKLDKFLEQYDRDMRGDMNADNGGRRGVVSNIRNLRKLWKDYPSLLWLFSHKPLQTVAVTVGIFILLSSLMTVGILNIIGAMVGVRMP